MYSFKAGNGSSFVFVLLFAVIIGLIDEVGQINRVLGGNCEMICRSCLNCAPTQEGGGRKEKIFFFFLMDHGPWLVTLSI